MLKPGQIIRDPRDAAERRWVSLTVVEGEINGFNDDGTFIIIDTMKRSDWGGINDKVIGDYLAVKPGRFKFYLLRKAEAEGWPLVPNPNQDAERDRDEARTKVQRLQAERAALPSPVEGVDLEEVLRLDREGTAGPWHCVGDNSAGFGVIADVVVETADGPLAPPPHEVCSAPGFSSYRAGAPWPRNAALIAYYRTAAPALVHEVAHLRDQTRRDAATFNAYRQATTTALGIDLNSCAEDVQAAVKELQLTLAAEQGRPEGAPSEGWCWMGAVWFHPATCMVVEPEGRLWRLNPDAGDKRRWRLSQLEPMPARVAMQTADAAMETT